MWLVLAIIIAIALAAVIYLATLDGNFRVKRSLEIDAPVESVFAAIVDFKSWPEWSPWLMHEPDTRIIYSDNHQQEGGHYSWDGKVVGAGKLTHLSLKPHSRIDQQIEFTRPFKSVNQVSWEFESRDQRTLVSWEMAGSMPFLFRFMTRRMEPMIGRDYELGLALLSGYMNSASAHPAISFVGAQELEDFSYWAVPCNGNLRQLEAARQPAIEALSAAAAGKTGLALTLYHQFDPQASSFQAEISIPISDSTPNSNYTRREFKGGRYFSVTLRGDHRFLPLGWYALSCHCRMHRIKPDKSRPALEIYQADPTQTKDSNQVITTLYLAIH
ncbi:MAG: SRPBCC family protein [Gammaproteobacteria bacterium]|nr:SRPBCC family protein [Gammaproteobacteria bacterium]